MDKERISISGRRYFISTESIGSRFEEESSKVVLVPRSSVSTKAQLFLDVVALYIQVLTQYHL